jgi:hypothetical protein
MDRTTFVNLAALAFALVTLGFITRGLSRLVVSTETAMALSSLPMLLGGALVVILVVRSVLAVSGIRRLS